MRVVFEPSEISAEELMALQSCVNHVIPPERLRFGGGSSSRTTQILVCTKGPHGPSLIATLRDGWKGVVLVPDARENRQTVLTAFFLEQPRYRLDKRAKPALVNDEPAQFVLDLTARPATFRTGGEL